MIKWLLISREHIYSTEASGVFEDARAARQRVRALPGRLPGDQEAGKAGASLRPITEWR